MNILSSYDGDSDESSVDLDPTNDNSVSQNADMPFRGLSINETKKSTKMKAKAANNDTFMKPIDLSKSLVISGPGPNKNQASVLQPFTDFGSQKGNSIKFLDPRIPIIAEKPLIPKLKSSEFSDSQRSVSSLQPFRSLANQPPNLSEKSPNFSAQDPIPFNNSKAKEYLPESNLIPNLEASSHAAFNIEKAGEITEDICIKPSITSKIEKPISNNGTGIDSSSFPIPFQTHEPEIKPLNLSKFGASSNINNEPGLNGSIQFLGEMRPPPPSLKQLSQQAKEKASNETQIKLPAEISPNPLLITPQFNEDSSKKSSNASEIKPPPLILPKVSENPPQLPNSLPFQNIPKIPSAGPFVQNSISTPTSKNIPELLVANPSSQQIPQLPPNLTHSSGNMPIIPDSKFTTSTENKTELSNGAPTKISQHPIPQIPPQFSASPPERFLPPPPLNNLLPPPLTTKTNQPFNQQIVNTPQLPPSRPQMPFPPSISQLPKDSPSSLYNPHLPAPNLDKNTMIHSSEVSLSKSQLIQRLTPSTGIVFPPDKLSAGFDKESPQVPKGASPSITLKGTTSNVPIVPPPLLINPAIKTEFKNEPPQLILSKGNAERSKIQKSESPPLNLSVTLPPYHECSSGTTPIFIPPPLIPNLGSSQLNLDPFKEYTEIALKKALATPKAPATQKEEPNETSCSECNSRKAEKILPCKHNLCKDCLERIVNRTVENCIYYSLCTPLYDIPVFCPCCNSRLPRKFYKTMHNIEGLYEKCKERYRTLVNSNEVCFECRILQPTDMFYENKSCRHICKDCVGSFLYAGINSCKYCSQKFIEKDLMENELQVCGSCNQQNSAQNGMFLHLCKLHMHCAECVLQAIKKNKCGECKSELGEDDWNRVKSRLRIIKLAY